MNLVRLMSVVVVKSDNEKNDFGLEYAKWTFRVDIRRLQSPEDQPLNGSSEIKSGDSHKGTKEKRAYQPDRGSRSRPLQ